MIPREDFQELRRNQVLTSPEALDEHMSRPIKLRQLCEELLHQEEEFYQDAGG